MECIMDGLELIALMIIGSLLTIAFLTSWALQIELLACKMER